MEEQIAGMRGRYGLILQPRAYQFSDSSIFHSFLKHTIQDCNACSYSNYSYERLLVCHYGTEFSRIESFMQPQSCARFEDDSIEGSFVKCLCDTGDNCSEKLMEEQQLRSEKVTCHLDTRGNKTCTGDFCFIIYGESLWDSLRYPERGCITNNETLSPNLYQPGHFTLTFLDTQLIICDKNKCNKNFKKAKKYVKITEPSCPAPAIAATTERNWAAGRVTKPNTIWTKIVNDFIASLIYS
ncbi:hypothetical protein PRIPAC_73247 [Pristionchus pacificus]|nr:hypothetical protein PRIPAC_73247 [Pristionchus pacificus]